MAPEDRSHVLPLEPFDLTAVPLSTHNIAWSPDAELAIGADDSIFLYLPEFPSFGTGFRTNSETQRQYYEAALRFPAIELRPPELNVHLFSIVGQDFPDFEASEGAGGSVVANIGSSMNHVVALEWSPNGLGRLNRSVLAVLTGSGALHVYCEGFVDHNDSVRLKGRNVRTIKTWEAAWGVGGNLLIPRAVKHESSLSKEYVTSFAWARKIQGRGALLAYQNDEDEVVILSVQSEHEPVGGEGKIGNWRVEEVARFSAEGPHPKGDPTDPDFSPSGSSFSLQWSPWLKKGGQRVAIISYVAKNYVGFRQISVSDTWKHMDTPTARVQQTDCNGVCLYLAPDAFVTWEDLVWTVNDSKICRGIIATPAKAQSFQVSFDHQPGESSVPHSTDHCETTYPPEDEIEQSSNPITGLVIHPPNLAQSTPSPYFSLVRLSATPTNFNWYQSNLPLPSNPQEPNPKPRWAADITRLTDSMMPLPLALRAAHPDGTTGSENGDESDIESEEEMDDDDWDDDLDAEFDKGEFLQQMRSVQDVEKVHTTRVRIFGMASSPGGGVTAIFVMPSHALRPDRLFFSGMRCKVLFGQSLAPIDKDVVVMKRMSTEGRMWEWMYGGGLAVPGVALGSEEEDLDKNRKQKALREVFKPVAARQACVFCNSPLELHDRISECAQGHAFQNCAATGVPILEPGISSTCGVCGRKSLKPAHLTELASDLVEIIDNEITTELCGGCGGKFIN